MFTLSLIEHSLPMPPHLLKRPLLDSIKAELDRLFLDKVIPNLGLCVPVYDIRSIEGGSIHAGEGCSTYTVSFRLLMFKPFAGEVLVGRISDYDDKGLQVSLDFFNDTCIPGHLMLYGTVRGADGRWMLKTEDGDELYLDLDDEIRFSVSSIKYPSIPVEQKWMTHHLLQCRLLEVLKEMVWVFLHGGQQTKRRGRRQPRNSKMLLQGTVCNLQIYPTSMLGNSV